MKLVLAAAAISLIATAAAEAACKPRQEIIDIITGPKYREHLHARGLRSETEMLELFVNEETGTWTALITTPSGISCHVASGQEWQLAKKGLTL